MRIHGKKFNTNPIKQAELKLVNEQVKEILSLEEQAAKEAGELGFMARGLVQATFPHKKVEGNEFVRKNGKYTLTILAPSKTGLPFGTTPRLLMNWVTTEAVRTKERELILGNSISGFMKGLGLIPSGGKNGTWGRFKGQMDRLFSCLITCDYSGDNRLERQNLILADDYRLLWIPKDSDQPLLWNTKITLSEKFFKEIINHPVPVDLRAIRFLKRSPLALDIYSWLTYRYSYLKRNVKIPWIMLQRQFGADYKETRQFKAAFDHQLQRVLLVYPKANVFMDDKGLILKRSPTHVLKACD